MKQTRKAGFKNSIFSETAQGSVFIVFFFTRLFFLFLLVRGLSFQKVLVWVLLGFFQIQKVLVFQLHGFRKFLKNYSAEVIYFGKVKKSTHFCTFSLKSIRLLVTRLRKNTRLNFTRLEKKYSFQLLVFLTSNW